MQYIFSCLEQLDRASLELNQEFPIFNRFALILIDNIVEVMCHKRCETIITKYSSWIFQEKDRISRTNQARILGKFFDQKLKFLKQKNEISQNEYAFIDISHSYRNLAYHLGTTHEKILFPLAWEYLEIACDLFARFETLFVCHSSTDKPTMAFKKHLKAAKIESDFFEKDLRKKLATSILSQRPPLQTPLPEVFSQEILEMISDIEGAIEFIVSFNPNRYNYAEVLRQSQFWHDLHENIPIEYDEGTIEYNLFLKKRATELKHSWQPKYSEIPIRNWRKRGETIAKSKKWGAIQNFINLKKEIDYLHQILTDEASQLDGYIQQKYDEYRGK